MDEGAALAALMPRIAAARLIWIESGHLTIFRLNKQISFFDGLRDPPDQQEINMTPEVFVPTTAAAQSLGLSPRTLEKLRITGGGPAFHKFGRRCLYSVEDLQSWAAARRRLSTSDSGFGPGAQP